MKVKNIKYTNANISFGYAYNWVFTRNCLACLSLTPAIAYKASDVDAETNEAKAWYGKFNLDFLVRAGIVYNTGKYYVGTSLLEKLQLSSQQFLCRQWIRYSPNICRIQLQHPQRIQEKEIIPQKLEIINLLAYPKNLCTFATF